MTTISSPSGRPQPAESNVLRHIGELERIGYRTVGSPEAVLGEDYVIAEVEKLDKMCKSQKGAKLDCDVWVQSGTGYHSYVQLLFVIADNSVSSIIAMTK